MIPVLRRVLRAPWQVVRLAGDLGVYTWRTGRWWVPVAVVVIAGATIAVAVAKVAVPTAVYVLF